MMQNSIHGVEVLSSYDGLVWDSMGSKQIDFTSGIFSASLGMFNFQVTKRVNKQLWKCMHAYQFETPIRRKYLKALCEFTGYEAAYMFSSGTEAVEAAWKIARRHTGKDGIIGLDHAFHGKTFGAQIAAGRETDWRGQTPGERTGAMIFEPYVAISAQFHNEKLINKIKAFRDTFGCLLIADEIQAGFYRTGKLFGYQWYDDLKPDLVCIGKGMCNGFPASAVLGPADLINSAAMDLSSTNGGNPLACAAGMAVIEQMDTEDFRSHLAEVSEAFCTGLNMLKQPVNCRGMVASIYFDSVQEADAAVVDLCRAGLLVVHTKKQTIKLGPPLNIPLRVLKNGLEILVDVLGG